MGISYKTAEFLIDSRMAEIGHGDVDAFYDLGICYQTGTAGVGIDLVAAHKWFNLAAVGGLDAAHDARTEVAHDMTARQIAEAQRQARAWLGATRLRAA